MLKTSLYNQNIYVGTVSNDIEKIYISRESNSLVLKVNYIVICSFRPKYAHAKIENIFQEVFSMWSAPCPLLGNGSLNAFQHNEYAENNQIASVAIQRAVNITEDEVFFYGFASRLYKLSNQKLVVGREREWSESSTGKEKGFCLL
jgi:hypothetical protein